MPSRAGRAGAIKISNLRFRRTWEKTSVQECPGKDAVRKHGLRFSVSHAPSKSLVDKDQSKAASKNTDLSFPELRKIREQSSSRREFDQWMTRLFNLRP